MKKSLALLVIATLVLPMLTLVAPVSASTGHPAIGTFDGTNLQIATTSANVTAGGIIVDAIDGATPFVINGNLTIIFTINSTLLVDFSGAQFDLYMSKNGYSNLTADDVLYASGFMVSDLNLPFGGQTYEITNARLLNGEGTFDLGTITTTTAEGTTTYKILTGPIPFDITNEYTYIKIFDGSATLIAAAGVIDILPAIDITPDVGPACAAITMTGVALAPNTLYNITFVDEGVLAGQVTTNADGKFTFVFNAFDLKNDECIDGFEWLNIEVKNAVTGEIIDNLYFGEISREIWNIWAGTSASTTGWVQGEFGNGTTCNITCVAAKIFDELWVEGDHWCPTSDIVIRLDNIVLGTFTANATGYFNATGMTIPIVSMGIHNLTVQNGDFFYQYCIDVQPTLHIDPDEGPCGTTIEITAYGFPAGTTVYLYYYGGCFFDTYPMWIANATVGSNGQFTSTITYTIPSSYGGNHEVAAYSGYGPSGDYLDGTYFLVTPSLWVSSDPVNMDGGYFTIYGCGLDPLRTYAGDTNNQAFNPYDLHPDCYGYIEITMLSAGLRPGLNGFALYDNGGWNSWNLNPFTDYGSYVPVATVTFTVSTTGDPLFELLDGCCGTIASIADDVATIKTNVGTLLTNVDALDAKIVALSDDVAVISTNIGNLQASIDAIGLKVVAINGTTATIQTSLGTIQGQVTAMAGDVATIKTDLGTVKTNVASIKAFLPVDMTPIWVAVILSLVAAIAAIYAVVVIRGKIAA